MNFAPDTEDIAIERSKKAVAQGKKHYTTIDSNCAVRVLVEGEDEDFNLKHWEISNEKNPGSHLVLIPRYLWKK